MNFGKFDVMILLTMSLAVIGMSFVFPALGLTGEQADDSQIPELEIDNDRFDLVGELPRRPGTSDTGFLEYRADGFDDRFAWVWHDGSVGRLSAETYVDGGDNDNGPITVQLQLWDEEGDSVEIENVELSGEGDRVELSVDGGEWTVRYEVDQWRNEGTDDFEVLVQFEVIDDATTEGGFLGTLFGAGEALASTVAWIGVVIYWGIFFIFEIGANLISMLYDVTSYLFGLIAWLTTTYTNIITGANSWASVFVALPGILLGAILAKMVFIGIQLLPTT